MESGEGTACSAKENLGQIYQTQIWGDLTLRRSLKKDRAILVSQVAVQDQEHVRNLLMVCKFLTSTLVQDVAGHVLEAAISETSYWWFYFYFCGDRTILYSSQMQDPCKP